MGTSDSGSIVQKRRICNFYRYATPLDKVQICSTLFVAFLGGALYICGTVLFAYIFGGLTEYSMVKASNTTLNETIQMNKKFDEKLTNYIQYTLLTGTGVIFAVYISSFFSIKMALKQTKELKKRIFKKLLYQDLAWYDIINYGNFGTILTENIPKVELAMGDHATSILYYMGTCTVASVAACILGKELGFAGLLISGIQWIIAKHITAFSKKYAKQQMDAYSTAGAIAEKVLSSIKTVILCNGQKKETKRYEVQIRNAQNNNIKRSFFDGVFTCAKYLVTHISFAVNFAFGIYLIIGELNVDPTLRIYKPTSTIMVFFLILVATWDFSVLTSLFATVAESYGGSYQVFQILDSETKINQDDDTGKISTLNGNITFRSVSFFYPSRKTEPALKNINLQIRGGENVAFVGRSGSGKSTMVQLMQRFYDPTFGIITIDGIDLKDINQKYLRSKVGVVNQEPVLFATTIAENIRYGKLDATFLEIETAAIKANAHQFIIKLPLGYQTMVGECGTQLSGGQKQKIAIARALIKNPVILILDEATSALDSTSEAEVQEALNGINDRECTKIVVAHRLSTIRNADKIVVFNDGEIVEEGSHDQLMTSEKQYYNMVTSRGYTEIESQRDEDKVNVNPPTIPTASKNELHLRLNESADVENVSRFNFNILSKILKEIRTEWSLVLLGCLTIVISSMSIPVFCIFFGDVITMTSIEDAKTAEAGIVRVVSKFLTLGLVAGLAGLGRTYFFGRAVEKLTFNLRNKMFSTMLEQEMPFFDKNENGVGALCAQLSDDAASVQEIGGEKLGSIINTICIIFFSSIACICLDFRLALTAGTSFILVLWVTYYQQVSSQKHSDMAQELRKNYVNIGIEAINNIRTVKSLGCESEFFNKFSDELDKYEQVSMRKAHLRSLILGLSKGLKFYSYVAGIRYGVYLMKSELIHAVIIFRIIYIIETTVYALGSALATSPNIGNGLSAASRIFKFLEEQPPKEDTTPHYWEKTDIKFENVDFKYPSRPNTKILTDFSLLVLNGQHVALVGASGSGKSTVLKLLARLYDPTSGNITVGDVNLLDMDLNCLRSQISIVSQDPCLFDVTIAENICYGVHDRTPTMEEIENVARVANIHDFIISLPKGYETPIGSKGTQLSGGEKQRIAIARALITNPKILLLDEATSALDNTNERVVQEALENARKGKTCITVAHRLTTIQNADLICVMKDGQIIETGTHDELLDRQGHYYEFYRLQSGQN